MTGKTTTAPKVSDATEALEPITCGWEIDGKSCPEPAAWHLIIHCCGHGSYLLCELHASVEDAQFRDGGMVHFPCDTDITSWTWMRVGE